MQSMILRQAMTSPPSLLVFLAIVISLSSCLQPVHAGFAFLANQAHCKLTCLNGGVCAFDTQQTNIHKCICFIGLFEGEQCQIQVTNEPSPSPNHQKDEEEEDEEEDIDEMDEEGEEHQALEDQQPEKVEQQHQEHSPPEQKQQEELEDKVEEEPYHQEVHEFAEANADEYETELSVVEPEEEDKQEVEVVTTETTQHTQSIDSSGSEEKFIEEVTPKQALPNIHLGDSSNFVDLPNNPRGIKHYENTRTRTPHSEDPVATAWEYRPRKGASSRGTQDNSTPPPPAQKPQERQQRRKKKPVKKQEEEELEESMPGGGWMMSKRGKQTGSSGTGSTSTTYTPCLLGALMLLLTNLRFHLL